MKVWSHNTVPIDDITGEMVYCSPSDEVNDLDMHIYIMYIDELEKKDRNYTL